MADAFSPNRNLILMQTGNDLGVWGTLLNNEAISIIDNNLGGNLSLSVAGSSDVNLTSTQAENLAYNFTGALTGNINVIWPTGAGFYIITNSTSGAFTLTVKPTGGTGIAIPQGGTAEVFVSTNTGTAFLTNNIFIQGSSPTFTGTVTINGNLSVVQAGSTQAYFGSTGSNASNVYIDTAATGQASVINFQTAEVTKWQIYKDGSGSFHIQDSASANNILVAASGGALTLGQAQNFTIDNSGNVGVTGSVTATSNGFGLAVVGSVASNGVGVNINNTSGHQWLLGSFGSTTVGLANSFAVYDQTTAESILILDSSGFGHLPIGAPSVGDNSDKIPTTSFVNAQIFSNQGVVTGSRAFGTAFHNTTNKAMIVTVTGTATSSTNDIQAFTDSNSSPSTQVSQNSAAGVTFTTNLTFVVLPNNYYKVVSVNHNLTFWTEWY